MGASLLPTTQRAVRALLECDQTITPKHRATVLKVLDLTTEQLDRAVRAANEPPPVVRGAAGEPAILRRREVAARLSISTRSVDRMVEAGALPKVTLPGFVRAVGFRANDVESLAAKLRIPADQAAAGG